MKYETAVPIGQGGVAEVLRAYDPDLRRDVALKLLRRDDPDLAERMVREAQAQARVEHPHVCPVYETGITDDGQLYIAMQYIHGESLDVAARAMSLEEKARVLREVALAVQAAHAAGLIHRDLKPGNVMIERQADGALKPWVVDFGLARQHDAPGITMTGQVMGTPAYMSPEQARGEHAGVDRRSDVYALGAVLYHLLTGRPPFTGQSTVEVLVRILQEEPTPVRRIAPRTPPDLETIVMKCLEKEPERRYQSARALAGDLTRFLEGEPIAARPASVAYRLVKKARKNKVVTVLAAILALGLPAGGLKYALDLRGERQRALAAQREAEDLMDFMLEDLYERLEPLGQVELLGEVARKSLRHHEGLPEHGGDPGELQRRARALRNVGRVLEAEGDLEGALASFQRFRSIMSELSAVEARPEWLLDLATSHRLVAKVLQEQGEIEEALAGYRQAMEIAGGLAARDASRAEWQEALWQARSDVGWLHLERGDYAAALEHLEAGLAVARRWAERSPAADPWRHNLAVSLAFIGLVYDEQAELEKALRFFGQALEASQALTSADPANALWLYEVSLNHGRIAYVLQKRGDLEGAAGAYRRSMEINERLVEQDPSNARWLRELGVNYSGLGAVLRRQGELAAAQEKMEASLGISRLLSARDPSNVSLKNDLAWDLIQVGMVRDARGDGAAARAACEEALAIVTPIAEATGVAYYVDTQVMALLSLGRVEEARPLVERLLADGWDDPELLELCREHGLLAAESPG